MSSINTTARELLLKVVFYGPGLGGKTTSLQAVFASAPPDRRGKLVSLATPVDRTLYFDFLPLRLPPYAGLSVRAQLFTVPGQVYFNATRRLVLAGADGIVFVADSQRERLEGNIESLDNLRENLIEHGRELSRVPHVMLWNKRDIEPATPIDELERVLNAHAAPSFATVATRGEGIPEALEKILQLVLAAQDLSAAALPSPAPPPARRSPPLAEGPSSSMLEDALAQAAHRQPSSPPRPLVARAPAEIDPQSVKPALKATNAAPPESTRDAPPLSRPTPSERVPPGTREYTDSTNAAPYPVSASLFPKALRESVPPRPATHASPPPPPTSLRASATGFLREPRTPRDIGPPPPSMPTTPATPRLLKQEHPRPSLPPSHPAPSPFSFSPLFAPAERHLVEQIEASIAYGAHGDALGICDATLRRMLAGIGTATGVEPTRGVDGSGEPTLLMAMGIEGRRWLAFRAALLRSRRGDAISARDALEAFAFLVEARIACTQAEALVSGGVEEPAAALGDSTPPLPQSTLSVPPPRPASVHPSSAEAASAPRPSVAPPAQIITAPRAEPIGER